MNGASTHLRGLFAHPVGAWVRPHRLASGGVIALVLRTTRMCVLHGVYRGQP